MHNSSCDSGAHHGVFSGVEEEGLVGAMGEDGLLALALTGLLALALTRLLAITLIPSVNIAVCSVAAVDEHFRLVSRQRLLLDAMTTALPVIAAGVRALPGVGVAVGLALTRLLAGKSRLCRLEVEDVITRIRDVVK